MGGAVGGVTLGGTGEGVEGRVPGQVVSYKDERLLGAVKELQAKGLPGSNALVALLEHLRTLGINLATTNDSPTTATPTGTIGSAATIISSSNSHSSSNRGISNIISNPLGFQSANANGATNGSATPNVSATCTSRSDRNPSGTTQRAATNRRDINRGSGGINRNAVAGNMTGEGACDLPEVLPPGASGILAGTNIRDNCMGAGSVLEVGFARVELEAVPEGGENWVAVAPAALKHNCVGHQAVGMEHQLAGLDFGSVCNAPHYVLGEEWLPSLDDAWQNDANWHIPEMQGSISHAQPHHHADVALHAGRITGPGSCNERMISLPHVEEGEGGMIESLIRNS